MKIKKEYIGAKCWSPTMSRFFLIEEIKGDFYANCGILYIYEEEKPKLIKHVDNTKKRKHTINRDGDGIDNNSESDILI